jgi:chromosome segregation ATPase
VNAHNPDERSNYTIMDPVKLQAQLVKLQSQADEYAREREANQRELVRLKEQNRRGDAELRKAEGRSKVMRATSPSCPQPLTRMSNLQQLY